MALNCGNFKNVAEIARRRFGERDILVCADDDGKNGVPLATTAAKAIGGKLAVPKFADGEVEGKDFNDLARLEGLEAVKQQVNEALVVQSLTPEPGNGDDLQRAFNDPRPKIRLPGPDRLLSDFAVELADAVHDKDIYLRNGEVVTLADNDLKPITPQAFRCWAERFFIGYRAKTIGENSFQFDVTMSDIKGKLSSEPLEAFLSAPVYGGRKLGVNENVTGDNVTTVFCTGNGMTVSPDMRRRSLFVELHLEVERAEDLKFSRVLDMPHLLAMRPKVLAALWAMVRHWDENGRPVPSSGHSAFPTWASMVGGIVEVAGFSCPLATANVTATADPDGEDIRLLVKEMASKPAPSPFGDLVKLAHEHGLFSNIIGEQGDELGRREKSAFARLLMRYDRRLVLDWHFIVEGQGRTRRYKVESCHGDMV